MISIFLNNNKCVSDVHTSWCYNSILYVNFAIKYLAATNDSNDYLLKPFIVGVKSVWRSDICFNKSNGN